MAPEVLYQMGYKGTKSDIWSLGVLLFTILQAKFPFDKQQIGNEDREEHFGQFNYNPKFELSDKAKDLLKQMLNVSVEGRLDIDGVLQHEWFRGAKVVKCNNFQQIQRVELIDKLMLSFGFTKKQIDLIFQQDLMNHISSCYYLLSKDL